MANKGIVTNVSKNPVPLPDGSILQAGEIREDFDEASLKGDLFFESGWLVVGKDAKTLQAQLDNSKTDSALLEAKVEELQEALQAETLRANEAEAKYDASSADKVKGLEDSLSTMTARAQAAEAKVEELQKPKK